MWRRYPRIFAKLKRNCASKRIVLDYSHMKSAVKTSPINMKARKDLGIRAGDTVRVWQNIVEMKTGKGANKKEVTTKNVRKQAFEGLVLAVKHGSEAGATFTVRRVASGVGVEKIFPLYSPTIDSIEVLRRARTRRAKLYFIREKASRDQKRAMRKSMQVSLSTADAPEEPVVDTTPLAAAEPEDLVPSGDVEPVEAQVTPEEVGVVSEVSSETTDETESQNRESVE